MRESQGQRRTVGLYIDRVIGATGERSAWPVASFERSRFLSDFAATEVDNFSQSLLAVTPYVSALYDNVADDGKVDGGVDVFWKPNGQMQLTATVNPDFGQVESDDLVVNFDATETFISDKRPFFTENQGPFEFTTPSDFSQLLYTRRIGGPADDGRGSGDITAALKWNGSIGATKSAAGMARNASDLPCARRSRSTSPRSSISSRHARSTNAGLSPGAMSRAASKMASARRNRSPDRSFASFTLSATGVRIELLVQPAARLCPVTLCRAQANAQRLGRLFLGEPRKEPAFDDACLTRVQCRETLEGVVERDE
jgi:hypothetical protein